jgi:hypothetical protein
VRAPQERRSLNDIVDAALKVIDPPAADREEWRAKVAFHIEYLEGIPREHLRTRDDGAKPFDLDAEAAVQAARDLIDERGIKAAISAKGAWHRLSQIIYESITGNSDKNVMHYLRHWKPEGPTDEEIEEMMSTTRMRNDA